MANTGSTNPDRQSGRIDIGGRLLAFVCAGAGPPTVILETGLGAESAEWAAVQDEVSKVARVLRYDRAGRGASDTAPSPRTALDMVGDLRELLRRTAIGGPYVLVGHSFGGLLARLFAHRHARDVAGVVLVDSMHEDQFDSFGQTFPPPFPGEPEELTRTRTFWQHGWRDPSSTAEGIDFVRSFEQAKEIGSLGTMPVQVITAGALLNQPSVPEKMRPMLQARWEELQTQFLSLSSNAKHSFVRNSGHFVQRDAPDAVSEVVKGMIAVWRKR